MASQLFCPAEAPGLQDIHGTDFDTPFTQYEQEGCMKHTIKVCKLWFAILILDVQIETSGPFMFYRLCKL